MEYLEQATTSDDQGRRCLEAQAEELEASENLNMALDKIRRHLKDYDVDLLSACFYAADDSSLVTRPFFLYRNEMVEVCDQLLTGGGNPFFKEAKIRMSAFDSLSVDISIYPSPLEQKFFLEVHEMGYKHVGLVPVMTGRALALFSVGLANHEFDGEKRQTTAYYLSRAVDALIDRFPEINSLSPRKYLSPLQRTILTQTCEGNSLSEICEMNRMSEFTIRLIIKDAAEKLEVENSQQLIFKALSLGEISPAKSVIRH